MRRLMKGLRRGEKGFTLIELLIVVAILGILAAVIIPNLAGFLKTGNLAAANTELENVKTAGLGYYADHNATWPATSDDLTAYMAGTLKAKYTFDGGATGTGFIILGVPTATGGWTGLTWSAPSTPYIAHGKWTRTP